MESLFNHEEAMRAFLYQAEKTATEKGMAQGMAQGNADGQDRMVALMDRLFNEGRYEDARSAARDRDTRERLLKEFGLAPA